MPARRLSITTAPKILTPQQGSGLREIEVPAGDHAYELRRPSGEQTLVFHLRHPETRLSLRVIVDAAGEDSPSLETRVIHHAPRTQAETVVKTLSRDKAQPRYRGLIRIEESAQECESYLSHHSLVLSPLAASHTIPSLEILADQVKCSHAATIRTITDNDLFYLRARGIGKDEARDTLVEAFLEN